MLYKREGSSVSFQEKNNHPCVFALQNILQLCEKTSMWASVTSESNGFGSEKRVLWAPNYSNKHLFSPNKHTFHGMPVSLSSVFARQSFFVPKNKSWVSHLQTAEKHGKSSVRFCFGAAPLVLISVFENVNLKNSP